MRSEALSKSMLPSWKCQTRSTQLQVLEAKCFNCGKTGHVAALHRVRRKPRPQSQRQLEENSQENILNLNAVEDKPDAVELKILLKVIPRT